MNKKKYDLAIIGAGAAGIFAAITAARRGCCVVLIEHTNQIGKKLLSTGNGRCNFTNAYQDETCYRSSSQKNYYSVIKDFDANQVKEFFEQLGMLTTEKNGYYYPYTQSASTVLELLRQELTRLKVKIKTNTSIVNIKKEKESFLLQCDNAYEIYADHCLLTTGSKAAAFTGSDGSGYKLAQGLGHHVVPVVPSLVALKSSDCFFQNIPRIRFDGNIVLYRNGASPIKEAGQLQLIEAGISGIPVFQLSRYAAYELREKRSVTAKISFVPLTKDQVMTYLSEQKRKDQGITLTNALMGLVDVKLIPAILKRLGLERQLPLSLAKQEELEALASFLTGFLFDITATKDYKDAQVCAGGIDLEEINLDTMESNLVPKLYFAGEILDVDGKCGGYNLQWAFSSAVKAATSISKQG